MTKVQRKKISDEVKKFIKESDVHFFKSLSKQINQKGWLSENQIKKVEFAIEKTKSEEEKEN